MLKTVPRDLGSNYVLVLENSNIYNVIGVIYNNAIYVKKRSSRLNKVKRQKARFFLC